MNGLQRHERNFAVAKTDDFGCNAAPTLGVDFTTRAEWRTDAPCCKQHPGNARQDALRLGRSKGNLLQSIRKTVCEHCHALPNIGGSRFQRFACCSQYQFSQFPQTKLDPVVDDPRGCLQYRATRLHRGV